MSDSDANSEENSEENPEDVKKPIDKKESLIRFGKLNKYYLIPFITPIIGVLVNCIIYFFNDKYEDKQLTIYSIESFTMFLSHITGGLLYFISSINSQTEKTRSEAKNENIKEINSIRFIYNSPKIRKNKLKIAFFIFFTSFFFTFTYIREIFYINDYEFGERLYSLFFVPLLSKIILKIGIYKHQKLSLLISFLGFLIFFIPSFIEIKKGLSIITIIIDNIITLIEIFFYSLYLVLSKYLMHNYYLSPFLCILQIGIISFILNILGYIFLYIFKKQNAFSDAFDLLKNIELKYGILLFVLYFILCIYHIYIFLVIYYFSPIFACISDIVNPLFNMIFGSIMKNKYKSYLILEILGYILILIAAFIYNEIIILNFCGFNEYTSICIKERGKEELDSIRFSSKSQSEENFIENEVEKTNE